MWTSRTPCFHPKILFVGGGHVIPVVAEGIIRSCLKDCRIKPRGRKKKESLLRKEHGLVLMSND